MSTQNPGAATAARQSNSDLSRSQRALISAHWSEVTLHLAPPGVTWKWSESAISHRVKYRWKCDGLIHRSADGDRWETSMSLWCHVIDRAADDETIGAEARGQETLDVPTGTSSTTRFLTDTPTSPSLSREHQSTLTGDVVDSRDTEEEMREPWRKDPTWREPAGKEKAAQHPAQTGLTAWVTEDGIDPDRWAVGPASATAGVRIAD